MGKAKIIQEFKGGSMARTFLIEKYGQFVVRKIAEKTKDGLGAEKLYNQWKWLFDFSRQEEGIFPDTGLFVIDKDKVYYDMEYLDMISLRDLLLQPTLERDHIFALLSTVLHVGSVIAEPITFYDQSYVKYVKNKHLVKMLQRCECISQFNFYNSDEIIINGKKMKNLVPLVNEIMNNKGLMKLLQPRSWFRSHGDFTFQNILTNGGELRIIDPRGEGPDTVYYDISKLYQSCHGKYDLLLEGNYFADTVTHNNIPYIEYGIREGVERFDMVFNVLHDMIPQYYELLDGEGELDSNWDLIARFYEASHFISMAPFRMKENMAITLTCYAIGLEILNDVVQEYKNML